MHTEMWLNAATQANVATLRSRGVTIVGPEVGQLTGTDSGPGRMSEPEDIVAAALAVAAPSGDLAERRILVTAGGTREPLDPVRFIGNRSSGKQGVAIALAAATRGADVTLICANLEIDAPTTVTVQHVGTTAELAKAVFAAAASADIIVMAAAVADYRPDTVADSKIKKENQGDTLTLNLIKNPDILSEVSATKRDGQTIVGFAAETETNKTALLEIARAKIARKKCDFLVVNSVGWTTGFATDGNTVTILKATGDIVGEASGTKSSVADRILDAIQPVSL
jgi:phosphopantothenoylcysteine decarboxylase/phosphopantothenate--cysteine ligase